MLASKRTLTYPEQNASASTTRNYTQCSSAVNNNSSTTVVVTSRDEITFDIMEVRRRGSCSTLDSIANYRISTSVSEQQQQQQQHYLGAIQSDHEQLSRSITLPF